MTAEEQPKAPGAKANATAATLRDTLNALGLNSDDVRQVQPRGDKFVTFGTMSKDGADLILDALLAHRVDRLFRRARPVTPIKHP